MIVGKRIREARLRSRLTQQELGDVINVTKTSVCCYEKGLRTPNVETLEAIAKALDIPVASLFSSNGVRDNSLIKRICMKKNIYEYIMDNCSKDEVEELKRIMNA